MDLGTLTASLFLDDSGLLSATVKIKQFEKQANQSLKGLGNSMQHFGVNASMYLTAPLALAGGAAFKMSKDFEKSMQEIVGLVGMSQKQVGEWSDEILQNAPKLGQAPNALADALYFVTSSGFKTADAMEIVNQSAKAASAGLGDAKKIADLATSAMNAYKDSNLQAATVVDILTAAVREGKGEAAQFASEMGEVIPVASRMGVAFSEVAAGMAAMTLTGSTVEETATYMRQILVSLLDATPKAENALQQMGTSSANLRKEIRDKGLLSALSTLNDLTKKYGEEMMGKVFGNIRALTGVLSLMGDRLEENRQLFSVVANSAGDMNKAFEVVSKTMDFKYNAAMSQLKSTTIQLGLSFRNSVIPMLEFFGKGLKSLANLYNSLGQTTQTVITIFLGLVAVTGPVVLAIAGMIKIFAALKGAILAINFAALISPLGVVLMAATALIGTFLVLNRTFSATSKEWETQADFLKTLQPIHDKYNKSLMQEVGNATALFSALKQTNEGTNIRKQLIQQVNTQYGTYLPNLLSEKSSLVEIQRAYQDVIVSMKSKLALEAQSSKISAIWAEQNRREQSSLQNYMGMFVAKDKREFFPLSAWLSQLNDFAGQAVDVFYTIDKNTGKQIWDTSSEELKSFAKATGVDLKSLIDYFSELSTARSVDNKVIQETIDLYGQVAGSTTTPNGGGGGGGTSTIDEIANKLKASKFALDNMRDAQKELGKGFDYNAALLKIYEKTLEDYLTIVDASDPRVQNLINQIKSLNAAMSSTDVSKMFSDQAKAMSTKSMLSKPANAEAILKTTEERSKAYAELQKQLAWVAYENAVVSDSFDYSEGQRQYDGITGKLQIYRQEMQRLFELQQANKDAGLSNTSVDAQLTTTTTYVKELQNQLSVLEAQQYIIDNMGWAFSKLGDAIGGSAGEFLNWVSKIITEVPKILEFLNALSIITGIQTVKTAAQATATATQSGANVALATSAAAAVMPLAAQTTAMIALAAASTSAAIAGAAAAAAWVLFPANLIAIPASIGAMTSALAAGTALAQTAVVGGAKAAAMMKEGGVVPSGYPNDTYPAMLTSGEMVTPPGKLPMDIGTPNNVMQGEVVFKISGDELQGILRKMGRKNQLV